MLDDLGRFVAAQQPVYDTVRAELRRGRKENHWMWFVFPQIAGLGRSAKAQRYAIRSLAEAQAYLAHPVLGARLRECVELLLRASDRSAENIFGAVDSTKLRSSLTLFAEAAPEKPLFRQALETFFQGEPDPLTLRLLRS